MPRILAARHGEQPLLLRLARRNGNCDGTAIPVLPGKGGLRVRRVFGDALLSGGALLLLLLALVAVDDRVRHQFSQGFRDARPTADLAEAGNRARDIAVVIVDAARNQAIEHAPLMLFAFAGTALVLFMIRT